MSLVKMCTSGSAKKNYEGAAQCSGLGGWMYFVPEGQHDQVRSAWVAIQKDPVLEGRSKLLSVPEIFVVETELLPLQKR